MRKELTGQKILLKRFITGAEYLLRLMLYLPENNLGKTSLQKRIIKVMTAI